MLLLGKEQQIKNREIWRLWNKQNLDLKDIVTALDNVSAAA